MSGERRVTCDDCFFRRALLCAIPGNTPCPTFRPVTSGAEGPRLRPPIGAARRKQLAGAAA